MQSKPIFPCSWEGTKKFDREHFSQWRRGNGVMFNCDVNGIHVDDVCASKKPDV